MSTEPKIIQISSSDGYGGFNALREDGSVISVTFGGGFSFVNLIPTKLGRNKLHIEERTNDNDDAEI